MLPSVLLTAMANVTTDYLADVTYGTVKILKRHLSIPLSGILLYDNTKDTAKALHPVDPSYKLLSEYNLLLTQGLTSYPLVLIGLY
jgi:hypothetical protein